MEMRRSRNSYMVSPRRVTMAAMSATNGSMILTFWVASPRPMLMTIFSSLGIAMALVMLSSLPSACLISVSYFCLSRAAMIVLRFLHGCRVGFQVPCTDAWGEPLLQGFGLLCFETDFCYFPLLFFSGIVLPLAFE